MDSPVHKEMRRTPIGYFSENKSPPTLPDERGYSSSPNIMPVGHGNSILSFIENNLPFLQKSSCFTKAISTEKLFAQLPINLQNLIEYGERN